MSIEADDSIKSRAAKDKHNEATRRYYARNREKMAAKRAAKREENKAYQKQWYQKNREKLLKKQRVYYAGHKDAVIAYQCEYQKKNREAVVKRAYEWVKRKRQDPEWDAKHRRGKVASLNKRLATDPCFRIVHNFRCRLKDLVRALAASKCAPTMELIGCSAAEFKIHLESQFEPWMNWGNYGFGDGKWVVDHITPLSRFQMDNPDDQLRAWHHSNLRPLCWRKNMEKSDKD